MNTTKWVTIGKKRCELIDQDVALQEKRIYPADTLPYPAHYQIVACKCTADIMCNLADAPCQWAYTNPFCNRFAEVYEPC